MKTIEEIEVLWEKENLEYFLLREKGDKELLERLFKEINELGNNPEYDNHEWDE